MHKGCENDCSVRYSSWYWFSLAVTAGGVWDTACMDGSIEYDPFASLLFVGHSLCHLFLSRFSVMLVFRGLSVLWYSLCNLVDEFVYVQRAWAVPLIFEPNQDLMLWWIGLGWPSMKIHFKSYPSMILRHRSTSLHCAPVNSGSTWSTVAARVSCHHTFR